jgi:starch phosphorylase
VKVVSKTGKRLFEVELYLGGLDLSDIRVELYAEGVNDGEPERVEMKRTKPMGDANGYIYSAKVRATRPATDYTARVIPQHAGVAVPLESAYILWQR